MDKPFMPIVLSTIFGILLSYHLKVSGIAMIIVLLLLIVVFIYRVICNKSSFVCILLIFFCLGSTLTNIHKTTELEDYRNKITNYRGIVDEVIKIRPEYTKYAIELKSVDSSIVKERIVLTIIGEGQYNLGDYILFNGKLEEPDRNTNPMLFNYRLSLLSNKIHNVMTVKDFSVSLIEKNASFNYKVKDRFKRDIENLYKNYLNEDNAKILTSIILGDSSHLDEEDLIKYRDLGLAHILAVSGLHIGIISGSLIYLLSRTGLNRRINIILSISIIWIYSYLIGFPPSTIRAGIMFTILYLSHLTHEPYDSINAVMFSMLFSLFINPFWIFDVGFQLSYLATISIIVFTSKIKLLFYPNKNNMIGTISSILAVNIGLLPIQSYYFNRISILGLIANLITVPLLSLTLILGMIMILFNYTISYVNIILAAVMDLLLSIVTIIINILGEIPFNVIKLYSPDLVTILLYYLAILIVLGVIDIYGYKTSLKKSISFYLAILTIASVIIITHDDHIEIDFIDVGQGDSILIKTQGYNYLMDTGGSLFSANDVGKYITLPYLEKQGIYNLDKVFITHFDEDHSQGLRALLSEVNIKEIYASYIPKNNEIIQILVEHNIPITVLRYGDVIYLDNNTNIKIIWPSKGTNINYSSNNMSLVSLMKYKNYNILFTGDIEKEVESIIGEKIDRKIDILKVPHHGSNTSSTEQFLEKIMPKHSVISVGRGNFYGHPKKDVLARLEKVGSSIHRTDEMGMIRTLLDDNYIEIIPYLEENVSNNNLVKVIIEYNNTLSFYVIYSFVSYLLIKRYLMFEKEGV